MRSRIIDIQRAGWRKDTPADVAQRVARRRAGELAVADRQARFPVLTAENADEAIEFQTARERHHMAALSAA